MAVALTKDIYVSRKATMDVDRTNLFHVLCVTRMLNQPQIVLNMQLEFPYEI